MGGGTATGGGFVPLAGGFCNDAGWCWENPLPMGADLNSIFVLSNDEAWAVGEHGITLHYLDGRWHWEPTGIQTELNAVTGTAPDDLWATGVGYTMLHWDGQGWSDAGLPFIGRLETITTLWAWDPQTVWAGSTGGGAFQPAVLTYDGGSWAKSVFAFSSINAIWGTAADDVWFNDALSTMWHYDGAQLTFLRDDAGSPLRLDNTYGLWGASRDSYWAGALFGQVLHYDGSAWKVAAQPGHLRALWGSSDNDVWGVGNAQLDAGRSWPYAGSDLFHGSTTQWSSQPAPTDRRLMAVHGTSASNVWVAGAGGTVLRYDGGTWAPLLPQSALLKAPLDSVWGSGPTNVWATGPDAGLLHSDGTGWSVAAPGSFTSLHGTAASDLWAVGPSGARHFDGQTWSDRSAGLDAGLVTVWAMSTSEVWGGSDDGTLYRWRPATGWTWSYKLPFGQTSLPDYHVGIWGSGPSDVYAGSWSKPAHFDGGTWGEIPVQKTSLGQGSPLGTLAHVWGTAPDNVYIDQGNGQVCRWTGSGVWQYIADFGGASPIGIDGTGPDDVWLIDKYSMKAWHWDGAGWTSSQLPVSNLHSFTVTDSHNLWAVGDNGQILRFTH